MPLSFTCPHCGHHTNVDSRYAGQSGPCASCGQTITIPADKTYGDSPPGEPRGGGGLAASLIIAACVVGILLLCGGAGAALLIPQMQSAREAARPAQCMMHLKQLGIAMHNYHDVWGVLPRADGAPAPAEHNEERDEEAVTAEAMPDAPSGPREGETQRSWRVLVLPFIEEPHLYGEFNFDEPWDSDHNLRVAARRMPPVYQCPAAEPRFKTIRGHRIQCASYVMLHGPGAMGEGVAFGEVPDGLSNTLMVVEVRGDDRPAWCEPFDLSIENLKNGVNNDFGMPSIGSHHPDGACIVFGDGSCRFLAEEVDIETLRRLGDRHDGAPVYLE